MKEKSKRRKYKDNPYTLIIKNKNTILNLIVMFVIEVSKEVFDMVSEKIDTETLLEAISGLPDIQRARICKYYFEHKTLVQIANKEGVWKYRNIRK